MNVRAAFSFILFFLSLTACNGEYSAGIPMATPSPQPSPSHTPDAYELALAGIRAQGTLDASVATSRVIYAQQTATSYAPTEQAIQTSTERAWQVMGWTATSAIEQTGTASSSTATAQSWTPTPNHTATIESSEVNARVAVLNGQVVSAELAIERARMMNKIQAAAPWVALGAAFVFTLALAWRWSQVRVIQRDLRGDAPLIITGATVYDSDRNPGPVLDMSSGKPAIPTLAPPEQQSATTSRDQLVDLATRGSFSGSQRRSAARMLANSLPVPDSSQPALPSIEVVDAVEVRAWIDEAEQKLLTDGGAE